MSGARSIHIRLLLVQARISQADLARELGLRRQSINGVVNGRYRSRRIQQHIAERLGCPFAQLWGDGGPQEKICPNLTSKASAKVGDERLEVPR